MSQMNQHEISMNAVRQMMSDKDMQIALLMSRVEYLEHELAAARESSEK